MAHNMAAIPGLGKAPVAFTHTFDLAKYVSAALDFEEWEPKYYVIGGKVTWIEFVKLVEAVKGFGLFFDDGTFDLKLEGALNEKCLEITPLKIKEALEAAAEKV
ncbi:hypothetical protein B0J13DRAFT_525560 [Dactylonectria estremocensis]|uniref:NmrA-like domain-containing protein n=1 Tax=Dactylonectria estremocensis TaxID=1079267 RepID=A0A9P9EUK4_9HYPO|nr:hypothetical protein B0J13DRAFT_525560 [Dactylonectria estremocensis]